jgi:integrase
MVVTGCRRGEGIGLAWRSVDLEGGSIRIEQQLITVGREHVFGPPKTEEAEREISLDPTTVEALRGHREAQKVERALFGDDYADHDLCFCQPDGRPLSPHGVSERFRTLVKAAGLPPIRLHDLRHSSATLALAEGVDTELLRRRLGHSKIGTTIDIYQRHQVADAERAAGDALAAAIDRT